MSVTKQYRLSGTSASQIALSVETAIREDRLGPGARLPTVRGLADDLAVSPTTVAAAYRMLRDRGLATGSGRRGTTVTDRPALPVRAAPPVPVGVRNLADGAPDPRLLPALGAALRRLPTTPRLYDAPTVLPRLRAAAADNLAADGIPADALTIVGGALDGIERVCAAHLRPGDRVAVEDPGYANLLDLLAAIGLRAEPVAVDADGLRPDGLARALRRGVRAAVITPRAQNPTGAAVTRARSTELRRVLRTAPDVLVIEDDHAAAVAGVPHHPVIGDRVRWAVVRSMSKQLGPDLRVAFLAGDPQTIGRVSGRHRLGAGWVSSLLQELVADLLSSDAAGRQLDRAARRYADRRAALVAALAARGVPSSGVSGLNVWVPVGDEVAAMQLLVEAGWAVAAGHRFRIRSEPGIRVCIASLTADEVERLAADLARSVAGPTLHYTG